MMAGRTAAVAAMAWCLSMHSRRRLLVSGMPLPLWVLYAVVWALALALEVVLAVVVVVAVFVFVTSRTAWKARRMTVAKPGDGTAVRSDERNEVLP
jgi:hypothetical protein